MYCTEVPVYSEEDLLYTLGKNNYSDEVWNYVSELTGLSVDRLNELLNELKTVDQIFTALCRETCGRYCLEKFRIM